MPETHVSSTPEENARAVAAFVTRLSAESITARGRFTIALSGGSTPRRLYALLAGKPLLDSLPWERWHVFWSDERCVPPDHRESNYRAAREALLDRAPIPPAQVHRMRGEGPPEDAAREYEAGLQSVLGARVPVIDLVLLGIGPDGHTASLFSGTAALAERRRFVVANWVPRLQERRLTFTLPLINAARHVAFLADDESKAEPVRQAVQPRPGEEPPPAALVLPRTGALDWFLTKAAAAKLTGAVSDLSLRLPLRAHRGSSRLRRAEGEVGEPSPFHSHRNLLACRSLKGAPPPAKGRRPPGACP